jgi:hypothetical protein
MSEEDNTYVKWSEVRAMMEQLDDDIAKNARGTAAAGVRARKGLRDMRKRISVIIKQMVVQDKEKRVAKLNEKTSAV